MFHYWRLVRSGLLFALLLAFASPQAQAEEPAAVKPWDQVAISALGEDFAKQAATNTSSIWARAARVHSGFVGVARLSITIQRTSLQRRIDDRLARERGPDVGKSLFA